MLKICLLPVVFLEFFGSMQVFREIVRFYFLFIQVSHAPLSSCAWQSCRLAGKSPHCPYLIAGLRVSFHFFLVILVVFVHVTGVVVVVVDVVPFFCRRCGNRLRGLSKSCLSFFDKIGFTTL